MRKLGVVFRREYLERVRSKWFLIGTLLGPVFFGVVTILPTYISMKQRPGNDLTNIVIVDATGTGLGARVSTELGRAFPVAPAPRVKVVPAERNTVANRSLTYAGRNAGSISDVNALLSKVKQQVLAQRLANEGLDAARVTALTSEKLETITEKIGNKGLEGGSGIGNLAFGYIIAFLLYMMIVLYGQNILRGVMEEKTTRVAEVVLSSVSPDTLLAGKVLGVGLVAITQVLSWAALTGGMVLYVGPLLFSGMGKGAATAGTGGGAGGGMPMNALMNALPSAGTAVVILSYFVLGFIFYSALFAAVGAMVSSQEDIQQASMPVMLMLVSSVIFMGPILTNPGSPLARTMTLLPFSAPILMPLRMSLMTVPWYEMAISLGGVAIACVLSIWLSARIYRVGLLMYGKRPSFRELARWVRYAG